jgi:hypothetical protein
MQIRPRALHPPPHPIIEPANLAINDLGVGSVGPGDLPDGGKGGEQGQDGGRAQRGLPEVHSHDQ